MDQSDFATVEAAMKWMHETVDDPYIDNERFSFEDDQQGMQDYHDCKSGGCCGFFDEEVTIQGRVAHIGCNFGH